MCESLYNGNKKKCILYWKSNPYKDPLAGMLKYLQLSVMERFTLLKDVCIGANLGT